MLMNVQQPLIFSHKSQDLFFKGKRSPLSLIFYSLTSLLLLLLLLLEVGTQVKHNIVENSAEVFDLAVLHLHMRNSHGS